MEIKINLFFKGDLTKTRSNTKNTHKDRKQKNPKKQEQAQGNHISTFQVN